MSDEKITDGGSPPIEPTPNLEAPGEEIVAVPDPGQEEGKPRKDDNTPPEGSKRWKEMYWKAQEFERQKETYEKAQKENSDLKEGFKALSEQNQKMMEAFDRRTEAIASPKPNPAQTIADQLSGIESRLKELRIKKQELTADGEYQEASVISDEITDLISERSDLKLTEFQDKIVKTTSTNIAKNKTTTDIQTFIKATPWLDKGNEQYDMYMEQAAIGVEESLRKEFPNNDERLKEVRKRVEARFGWSGGGEGNLDNRTGSAPPVRTPGGNTPPAQRGKIVLNDDQKRVARLMFPDDPNAEEIYMKQLAITG